MIELLKQIAAKGISFSWSWKCDPELWVAKMIRKLTGKKEVK